MKTSRALLCAALAAALPLAASAFEPSAFAEKSAAMAARLAEKSGDAAPAALRTLANAVAPSAAARAGTPTGEALAFLVSSLRSEASRIEAARADAGTSLGDLFKHENRTNGKCGTAHAKAATAAPSTGLCALGDASDLSGRGPWYWQCDGRGSGTSAFCAADAAGDAGRGECGNADGQRATASLKADSAGLCAAGRAASFEVRRNADGKAEGWSWKCSVPSGNNASCSASASSYGDGYGDFRGACGTANGKSMSARPWYGLCKSGEPSYVTGTGPWEWTCQGSAHEADAYCTASRATPTLGCAAQSVARDGKQYELPEGADGALVTAAAKSAILGGYRYAASAFRCASGVWKGEGTPRGSISCSEGYAANADTGLCSPKWRYEGACGDAAGSDWSEVPDNGLCANGNATYPVQSGNRWKWSCVVAGGTSASCTAGARGDSACGPTDGTVSYGKPTYGLCSAGSASFVREGWGEWTWTCGSGNAAAKCSANKPKDAAATPACGWADGNNYFSVPTEGLCIRGTAGAASGNGPWTWSCAYPGAASVTCRAGVVGK